jgi:hypothetical protein
MKRVLCIGAGLAVIIVALWSLSLALFGPAAAGAGENRTAVLIDDFQRADGLSALGTAWQVFTDRVMGGVSRGSAARETDESRPHLRLRGEVSLENNGGFIQAALPLRVEGRPLDASGFTGIRLTVRGDGETYYVHLRSTDTRLPWQYYQAGFATVRQWQDVDIPFAAFQGENLDAPLDPSRLERVGIVAAKKAFTADVAVARIALYR